MALFAGGATFYKFGPDFDVDGSSTSSRRFRAATEHYSRQHDGRPPYLEVSRKKTIFF